MVAARDNYPRDGMTHSYTASFAEVEVDVETGNYRVVDFLADVGTVIHPRALGGQILGRSVLNIGHAIGQKWVFDPAVRHHGFDAVLSEQAAIDSGCTRQAEGSTRYHDGVEIGAMTTLTEVVNNPIIREKYSLLAQAAELVASPQIRNQGTIGGNLSQDARCWYYRAGWPCYRADGNICYADTPTARNREHAILHADRCVAVNPSDSAPALIALDAKFVIRAPKGERIVDADDYFIGPEIDITRLTILEPGDLLIAIRIPSTWAGAKFYFEKVRDRNVWDFAPLNVASAMAVCSCACVQSSCHAIPICSAI